MSLFASTNDTTSTRFTVKCDADPINLAIGEFTLLQTLSSLRGPLPLDFQLYYGSARNTRRLADGLPFKFAHNLHGTLVHDTATEIISVEPGLASEIAFLKQGPDWVVARNEPSRLQLLESGDFYYVIDPIAETLDIYRRAATNGTEIAATLRARLDRNGNRLIFAPPADPTLHGPLSVTDTLGRSYTFTYNPVGVVDTDPYLTQLTDHGGRQWQFVYEENPPDAPGRVTLRSIVDPANRTYQFAYFTNGFHFLHALTLPRGNTPSRQFYRTTEPEDNFRGLVTSQTDARNQRWQVSPDRFAPFEDPLSRFTLTQPDGTTRGFLHDHFGRVARRFVDEEGRAVEFASDFERDLFTGLTDRRGHTTRVAHHDSGKIASFINANGFRTDLTHTLRLQTLVNPFNLENIPCRFFDLTRVDHPDGTFEEFTHDERGNVLVARDRVGALTRYGYNSRGQLGARTNALGGIVTFTYDAAGNLAALADSDGVSLTFGYDALFRRTSITNADASVVRYEYDPLDRLVAVVDELGTRLEITYDPNGNPTEVVRAAGTALAQTQQLEYDDLDRLIRLVDPAGFATTFSHTYRGALERTTYPDGTSMRAGYDRRQFPVEFEDEAGHVVRVQRDPEALPTFLLTPAGRRFRAVFDPLGLPIELFDALTNRYRVAYDSLQRPTNIVDRLGRGLNLHRDAEGRITSLQLPIVGANQYVRNALGQISTLTDFRGASWQFQYTPMGRLQAVTDPLARSVNFTYDNRGRLHQITHPDGIVETLAYDAASSLVARNFSSGLSLTYQRDALRRLTGTTSVPVQLAHNNRDLPTTATIHGATFTAAYDSRRRLQSLDYAGLTSIAYTYDPRGLVTRVQDSRTGAFVEMDYDPDRRLHRLRRSNGAHTEFSHDPNGLVARIHHLGKADLNLTRNAGSEITRLSATGLLDIAAFLPTESLSLAYDAAHQLTPAGFAHDLRGRRTQDPQRQYGWDAADRLLAITNGPTVVLQEFTARGDVAIESVDGVATEFFHHDAIARRPVLAERRAGAYRRYYVFTPHGTLLLAVNLPAETPSFYHFNHAGSTVLLTGPNGQVTDSYGYTPYGRPIRHEGPSDQPFTFNGQVGVREIANTALFHMGARFYDSLTARFLSRDPAWLGLLERPSDLNPYGFAGQNPVSFFDPDGRKGVFVNPDGSPVGDLAQVPIGGIVSHVDVLGNVEWAMKLPTPPASSNLPSEPFVDLSPGGGRDGFILKRLDNFRPFNNCSSIPVQGSHPPGSKPAVDLAELDRPYLPPPRQRIPAVDFSPGLVEFQNSLAVEQSKESGRPLADVLASSPARPTKPWEQLASELEAFHSPSKVPQECSGCVNQPCRIADHHPLGAPTAHPGQQLGLRLLPLAALGLLWLIATLLLRRGRQAKR